LLFHPFPQMTPMDADYFVGTHRRGVRSLNFRKTLWIAPVTTVAVWGHTIWRKASGARFPTPERGVNVPEWITISRASLNCAATQLVKTGLRRRLRCL